MWSKLALSTLLASSDKEFVKTYESRPRGPEFWKKLKKEIKSDTEEMSDEDVYFIEASFRSLFDEMSCFSRAPLSFKFNRGNLDKANLMSDQVK